MLTDFMYLIKSLLMNHLKKKAAKFNEPYSKS